MALENTDKAFAGILDAVKQFSEQVQPDVFNAFSNVAMLSAQQELVMAHICIWLGSVLLALAILCLFATIFGNGGEAGGFAMLLFLSLGLGFIIFNLSTVYSPLVQAAAHDGKVAIAREALTKIERSP